MSKQPLVTTSFLPLARRLLGTIFAKSSQAMILSRKFTPHLLRPTDGNDFTVVQLLLFVPLCFE